MARSNRDKWLLYYFPSGRDSLQDDIASRHTRKTLDSAPRGHQNVSTSDPRNNLKSMSTEVVDETSEELSALSRAVGPRWDPAPRVVANVRLLWHRESRIRSGAEQRVQPDVQRDRHLALCQQQDGWRRGPALCGLQLRQCWAGGSDRRTKQSQSILCHD